GHGCDRSSLGCVSRMRAADGAGIVLFAKVRVSYGDEISICFRDCHSVYDDKDRCQDESHTLYTSYTASFVSSSSVLSTSGSLETVGGPCRHPIKAAVKRARVFFSAR